MINVLSFFFLPFAKISGLLPFVLMQKYTQAVSLTHIKRQASSQEPVGGYSGCHFMSLPHAKMTLSSAFIRVLNSGHASGRLLLCISNKRGPKTEPCGTQQIKSSCLQLSYIVLLLNRTPSMRVHLLRNSKQTVSNQVACDLLN